MKFFFKLLFAFLILATLSFSKEIDNNNLLEEEITSSNKGVHLQCFPALKYKGYFECSYQILLTNNPDIGNWQEESFFASLYDSATLTQKINSFGGDVNLLNGADEIKKFHRIADQSANKPAINNKSALKFVKDKQNKILKYRTKNPDHEARDIVLNYIPKHPTENDFKVFLLYGDGIGADKWVRCSEKRNCPMCYGNHCLLQYLPHSSTDTNYGIYEGTYVTFTFLAPIKNAKDRDVIDDEDNNSTQGVNDKDNLNSKDDTQNDSDTNHENLDGKGYNYTLELDFKKSNHLYGDIAIQARWDNFKINFGKKNQIPHSINTSNFSNTQPPYTLAYPTESGIIHISGLPSNQQISSHNLKVSGGIYEGGIKNYKINFDEEYLTNPPDLLLLKDNKISEECYGSISKGVYLIWQFDIWGDMPELGYSQLFDVGTTYCPIFSNKTQASYDAVLVDVDAKVPDDIVKLMKEGKAFIFSKSNNFGATYTVKGTPKK
ncbi:MAG: hypothetical protein KU29_09160 [Sulfurovum sp. FS06-10]|jgi:hypothetical protein|nr:MAG: hypothetical protein KU29_09160 [Sulfurovum sp. FS06-10]